MRARVVMPSEFRCLSASALFAYASSVCVTQCLYKCKCTNLQPRLRALQSDAKRVQMLERVGLVGEVQLRERVHNLPAVLHLRCLQYPYT